MTKKTTEQFIKEARNVHGNKYSYKKTVYITKRQKVCITCPVHGDFWQMPYSHLQGCGCKKCRDENLKTTYEEFVERANSIHKEKYDYSIITKENFNGISSYVEIICPVHGVFRQKAIDHVKGKGCPKCAFDKIRGTKSMGKDGFISRAKDMYGNRFDFSKVVFVNVNTEVIITCPIHGDFLVKPKYFLRGYGCPKCDGFKKYDTKLFIESAKKIHGDKYDYSRVNYVNSHTKVCIICPTHGEFWQEPNSHLNGRGCRQCADMERSKNLRHNTERFIEKARAVHGDTYIYDKTAYIKDSMHVLITCRIHGDFMQIANAHLSGCGCPLCKQSHGEERVRLYLEKEGVKYIPQYKIANESILCKNKYIYVDFFIPDKNVIIEFQGEQHYKPTGFVNSKETFESQQYRDESVKFFCKNHGIKLIEIPYTEFDKIEKILKRKLKQQINYEQSNTIEAEQCCYP